MFGVGDGSGVGGGVGGVHNVLLASVIFLSYLHLVVLGTSETPLMLRCSHVLGTFETLLMLRCSYVLGTLRRS